MPMGGVKRGQKHSEKYFFLGKIMNFIIIQ